MLLALSTINLAFPLLYQWIYNRAKFNFYAPEYRPELWIMLLFGHAKENYDYFMVEVKGVCRHLPGSVIRIRTFWPLSDQVQESAGNATW